MNAYPYFHNIKLQVVTLHLICERLAPPRTHRIEGLVRDDAVKLFARRAAGAAPYESEITELKFLDAIDESVFEEP